MAEVARVLGLEKTCTTPHHLQADGQVERFNRMFRAMLTAVVSPDQRDWDYDLRFLTVTYWATAHPATGFSPNFLMFRREVTLPVDVIYDCPRERKRYPQIAFLAWYKSCSRVHSERLTTI